MSVCDSPVLWEADGEVAMRCDARKPCPYHDRNGLTVDQRREWRRTWTHKYWRDRAAKRHGLSQ